jgi:hypothetical protein
MGLGRAKSEGLKITVKEDIYAIQANTLLFHYMNGT